MLNGILNWSLVFFIAVLIYNQYILSSEFQ